LTIYDFGINNNIGNLAASAGDTTLTLQNYQSNVDPATIQAINNALALAINIMRDIAVFGDKPGKVASLPTLTDKYVALNEALNTAYNLSVAMQPTIPTTQPSRSYRRQ
jgi:hypothetical protein